MIRWEIYSDSWRLGSLWAMDKASALVQARRVYGFKELLWVWNLDSDIWKIDHDTVGAY